MILERSMSREWLSNTYLVGDRPGGHAVLIDTGGPPEPILAKIDEHRLTVTHVLCTHHHHDHVAHNDRFRDRFGCPVCAHDREAPLLPGLDRTLQDGELIESGDLRVRALHIPGHTAGQLAFVVDEERVFTGDTLFRGSVGGTRAPGHTSYADIRRSILDVLLELPSEMAVHPGHTDSTTIGREARENPFVRAWRGIDLPAPRRAKAFGQPADLLLRAPDYDGGTKCWVRFLDTGIEDVVPGSRVVDERAGR